MSQQRKRTHDCKLLLYGITPYTSLKKSRRKNIPGSRILTRTSFVHP